MNEEIMELKTLLQGVIEKFNASQEAREKAEAALEGKIKSLGENYAKLEKSQDADEINKVKSTIAELENEISDVRTKAATPIQTTKDEHEAVKSVVRSSIGELLKGGKDSNTMDLLKGVGAAIGEKVKALNIGTGTDGGLAIAEVLRRDVIEYAREYSPVMGLVGRNPVMTRDYRQLVLIGYPSVAKGVENIPGSVLPQTDTQTYAEVKSQAWKVYAKPRITDEAMVATDIDVYSHLLSLLGQEMGIYQAAQVLQGSGTTSGTETNARGILSYRVDITDGTGESFKPTIATDPADARDHNIYPVKPTGVSGGIGTDDEAIVNYFIDLINEFPSMFLNGSYFMMNRKTKGVLEKVRDSDGKPIFISSYKDGGSVTIMGYPVIIDDTMPNIAVDSTPIIFGRLDRAYYVNDGDIDKMLLDPYSVDQCTLVKTSKEMFEMVGNSDAIMIVGCTTNGPA